MSHIHLPDGVLPIWLWALGYLILGIYLIFVSFKFKKEQMGKNYALTGILAALMLITMSLEIAPIGYHINLAALTGILLGPVLSVLAILVVNIFLAFLGHGGITVIGLNTIVVSIEALTGFFGFKLLFSKTKKIMFSAFIATFIALFLSTWATIGIVYSGTHNLSETMHEHEAGIHAVEVGHNEAAKEQFDIRKFMILVFAFGMIGWLIESTMTAFIIRYVSRIKPDVLENSLNMDITEK